ncbi:hypothetical protein MRX96_028811 [Rhipicephalus microplus]
MSVKPTVPEDGLTAQQLLGSNEGLTYNDFIILPGYVDFDAQEVDLTSKLTKKIRSRDTIGVITHGHGSRSRRWPSPWRSAGGIGIIHNNCTAEHQAEEVKRVKRYQHGFINNPVVLSPDKCVADVMDVKKTRGFTGVPITDTGALGGKLLGMVTARDIDFFPPDKHDTRPF